MAVIEPSSPPYFSKGQSYQSYYNPFHLAPSAYSSNSIFTRSSSCVFLYSNTLTTNFSIVTFNSSHLASATALAFGISFSIVASYPNPFATFSPSRITFYVHCLPPTAFSLWPNLFQPSSSFGGLWGTDCSPFLRCFSFCHCLPPTTYY